MIHDGERFASTHLAVHYFASIIIYIDNLRAWRNIQQLKMATVFQLLLIFNINNNVASDLECSALLCTWYWTVSLHLLPRQCNRVCQVTRSNYWNTGVQHIGKYLSSHTRKLLVSCSRKYFRPCCGAHKQ